ncbi:unnamed protein product [Cylindrotheca closterium]|uniref:Spore protein YkvP/CgeB glycosyl transferase-like domain-containing protein n=1 Tax=Cylindrotheca closterium TaxID=2856 RepID=A0AAD2JPP9_9STRA|nr:unnamed protein product [Cylindrotheca closterium]
MYTNIRVTGRSWRRERGLPSNFDLAVLIIVAYGVFITLTGFGMTKRISHFDRAQHDFHRRQQHRPRYKKITLNKMGKVTAENSVGVMKPLIPKASDAESIIQTEAGEDGDTNKEESEETNGSPTEESSSVDTTPEQTAITKSTIVQPKKNVGQPIEKSYLAIPGAAAKKQSPELTGDANRLQWYDVIKNSPMYDEIPDQPLKVGLITRDLKAGPTNHVMMDGMRNSNHLELTKICYVTKKNGCGLMAEDPSIDLWLIDANGIKTKAKPGDLVHQLLDVVNPHFQMLFIDYSDRFVPKGGFLENHYPDVPATKFEQGHIRFAIRCIVKSRIFRVKTMPYVKLGTLVSPDYHDNLSTKQGLPFHAPFAVRTDFVNSIQDLIGSLVANQTSVKTNPSSIPYHPAFVMERPLDVTHLWEVLLPSKNNDLRNLVTEKVQAMSNLPHPLEKDRKIVVDTSIQGDRAHKGRWGVSDAYATTLLHSKIVVVTQRDQWEDHFRLFEATASGAMVLMDVMLSLPHSLQNGESVVFFTSLEDLQEKALYYLEHEDERIAIARKGWEISMEKHRSWHRMEEMLFGRGVTDTRIEDSWNPPPPPGGENNNE